MGLIITTNSKGLYKVKSSISDEILHEKKWITEEEVKKLLIERAYCNFVELAMKISMDFPRSYYVNGVYTMFDENIESGNHYICEIYESKLGYNQIFLDFNDVIDKLKLDIPKDNNI